MSDGFEVVESKMLPVWNGMTKKNADGESVPLEKSDKSYVIGYYMGMDFIKGKTGKDIVVHKLQFESCGNKEHLSEEVKEGDNIMIWGSAALDDNLHKNVPIGVRTKILWTGKVVSKTNSGQKYHTFELSIDKSKTISAPVQNSPKPTPQKDTTVNQTAEMPVSDSMDDEDEIPF